ncbi:MAG: exosortase-associated EpsI family protein [Phycisphaerales bacterium]
MSEPQGTTGSRLPLSITLLVMMLASAVAISAYIRVKDVHLQKIPIYPENNRQVSNLPSLTPSWRQVGSDDIMSAELVETLGTENYLSRRYLRTRDADPKRPIVIDLHVAYYTGMIDTVPHVPERCFVGGGLQQSESSRVIDLPMDTSSWRVDPSVPREFAGLSGEIFTVRLSNDPEMSDAPGRRVRLPRGISPEQPFQFRASEFINPGRGNVYAGYYFIANGGTKANANDVRQLAFNLEDDYAYYLKVQVSSSSFGSFEEFSEYSGELVGELIGEIMRCVPDWVSVQQGTYPPDNPRGAQGQQ